MDQNYIAVVGIGCHYPGASDLKELWENLLARRRQFREMPNERLPLAEYYHNNPDTPDKTYGRHAAVIDGFEFDWVKRRIPKSTYESSDIVHWLALEVATQAIIDAGYSRENIPKDKTGVILGNTLTGEFMRSNTMRLRWPYVRKTLRAAGIAQGLSSETLSKLEKYMEGIYKSVFPPVTEDTLAGSLSNTVAGRICNFYDLHGGGYVVDGACSSSLIAVATAADKLAKGELDLALAGGVDISLDPMEIIGFAKAGALTNKDMNVYDRNSSGFIPGEGCGFVILKRLEDAKRDGDYVYAVIRGWGISSDGKGGITAPKTEGQALALRRAYEMVDYSPHELDFIEGHGTGTVVGDRTELEAISLARNSFGDAELRSCGVTSFKSIVGHTKAAAGIGGLIKAVLSVNQRILLPTAACKEPNEIFYTQAKDIYPILQGEVRAPDQVMRAGISAMGFGGINCHVTIESADLPKQELKSSIEERALLASNQDTELIVFAANTKEDLLTQVEEVYKMASGMSIAEITDLAYHLTHQVKSKDKVRAAVITDHPDRLTDQLHYLTKKLANDFPSKGEVFVNMEKQCWISNQVSKHQVGFLFPGQGSQKVNMARTLLERFPWAREIAEKVWDVLPHGNQVMFRSLDKAINQDEIKDWEKQLSQTEIAQPTICLSSVLWTLFLKRLGIQPVVTAGHSLGELTALFAAGAYDEETLFKLAALRGQIMSSSSDEAGSMASLSCNQEEAENILANISGYAVIANLNSPKQTVISGEKEAISEAVKLAKNRQIQAINLPVSNAFHSELVKKASDILRQQAPLPMETINLTVPFISGIDGKVVQNFSDLKEYLANQVTQQVDFISLTSTIQKQCDLLVEVGPGRVLTGLVNSHSEGELPCFPIESKPGSSRDLHLFLATYFIYGGQIHWDVLYENRLVRPFVPAREKNFIVNPCENPISMTDSNKVDHFTDLTSLLPQASDLPAELVANYLKQRGEFILDVIRADLKNTTSVPSVPVVKQSIIPENQIEPSSRSIDQSIGTLEQTVIRLAAELTGFPTDSIQLTHRLLDDLNLDSIKSAELVSSLAQSFQVADQLDPSGFTNATLKDIIHEIEALLPDQATLEPKKIHHDISHVLIQHVEKITGYPRNSIHMDLRLLDDLNLDSIKSTEFVASVAKELNITDQIDPSQFANATLHDVQLYFESLVPQTDRQQTVAESLISKTIQLTGFPRESISMNLRLLDDLNLDSIKSAELVSQVAKEYELEKNIDPSLFANATLGDIEKSLTEWTTAVPKKPKPLHSKLTKSPTQTWVRNFAVNYIEDQSIHTENISFPNSSYFLIVAENTEDSLVQMLEGELNQLQISSHTTTFAMLKEKQHLKKEAFSHIIVILPKSDLSDDITNMVERLQSVIEPVKDHGYQASITYIQYAGGTFGNDSDSFQLSSCGAHAFAASLHMERPHAKIRVIDLSPKLQAEEIVTNVLAEISAEDSFISVGYDQYKVRRVPQAVVQQPSQYPRRSIEWSEEDVILVTGGAKGITAECALAVAKSANTKMALVGSSRIEDSLEIQQTMERFYQAGITCQYYQCDITNRSHVEELVNSVQTDLGQITGVIHGAGLVRSRRAEQTSLQSFLEEIGPKVFGAMHLGEVLKNQPPKLWIGFTSLTGITGMSGNTSYGFSNEVLQLFLQRFEKAHPETQVCSIAYSVWDEVGMGTRSDSIRFLEKKGIYAIPLDEGVKRFVHIFHHDPQAKQVVIAAKLDRVDTWHPRPVKREKEFRFVEDIIYDYPEVELITRVHLSLDKDPYVEEHQFNGSYLFPAVFGLEAMAQAVSYVTGIQDFSRVRVEDIQFKLPIVVDPQKGRRLEIRAEVLEDKRVVAEIRTEQTGFSQVHFSATYVFPSETDVHEKSIVFPEQPLAFTPKDDFYKPLMFQGPSYHRLEQVYKVSHDPIEHTGSCLFAAHSHSIDEYLLGDPYYHDAIMQSARVITPQDECLPVEIASFEKFGLYPYLSGSWKGVTRLKERNGFYYTYTIEILDEENRVIQSLTDFKVRIMENKPELPTAEELFSSASVDERMLTQALQTYSDQFQLAPPVITVAHFSQIHQQKKEQRHARVLPLFQRALTKANTTHEDYSLAWDETGKPSILKHGKQISDLQVSFSHDDEITICTIGSNKQGCDILPIENHRSEEDWINLLTSKYQPLLQSLRESGDSVVEAGSRIWSCLEAAKKASGKQIEEIILREVIGQAVLFEVISQKISYLVITFPIQLSKPLPRMLAIVASSHSLESSEDLLYGRFDAEHGFVYRFPLTFKDTPTLSRHVNLSSYSAWMGKVRELSLTNILESVAEQFATGKWGMVTNFVQTEITGEAASHDIIEVHLQIEQIQKDSYIEIVYYWYKVKDNHTLELIATSRQGLTWVEIIGHGLVKVSPFPAYFKQFLEEKLVVMSSREKLLNQNKILSTELLGKELFSVKTGPLNRLILQKNTFITSLEESNLVGNIYFSNYTIWQGKVRDQFFYQLAPELFQGTGEQGEWIALNTHIQHLREAMPFDTIEVEMSLAKRYEYGVKLFFEYYKLASDGQKQKLAFGEQDIVWIKRDENGKPHSSSLPDVFDQAFMNVTNQVHS
ncbi:type I polyketide synthase [Thermoflavimicrobium daqui]|uniref:Type I polyketide synthase n=1 Tax=Thermoflavimicrobium daqui TaxID=2137476 RepID=A0A364K9R3_9BACL|nr:type I polyketide synthase [Thermoflavimicrobium daqui]RAL26962.1 type I polyketide synthase [Thermoflavimicrobium daqui]